MVRFKGAVSPQSQHGGEPRVVYALTGAHRKKFLFLEYLTITIHCNTAELLSEVSITYDCIIISDDFNIHIDIETDPDAKNCNN